MTKMCSADTRSFQRAMFCASWLSCASLLCGLLLACGDDDSQPLDAAAEDAPSIDGTPSDSATSDAARDAAADASTQDAAPAAQCQAEAEAQGWDYCDGDSQRCGVVFSDGAGCEAVCRALGLTCLQAYENQEGVCAADRDRPSLGCGSTDHGSDYCECGGGTTATDAGMPVDAGPIDAAVPDGGPVTCMGLEATQVYLVGDSTVASGSGWGDGLMGHLHMATVTNTGRGGRSSKSFYDEGAFDDVRDALAPGDYVLIQFGHNDAKPEAYRHTEPGEPPAYEGTYREYLERYIDEVRAAGATPILLTPISRMVFGSSGLSRTHGAYPAAARQVAMDAGVVLLDLEEHSFQIFNTLGEAETRRLYAIDDEPSDRTHFPPEKAPRLAEMVRDLLRMSTSSLRCFVRDEPGM